MTTSGRPGARKLSVAAREALLIETYFALPAGERAKAREGMGAEERRIVRQAQAGAQNEDGAGVRAGAIKKHNEVTRGR